jgi:hypothetical protein
VYQTETDFLQQRAATSRENLADRLEHLATETANQEDWLEIEHESLAIHRREMAILDDLLTTEHRKHHDLECIVGHQIRHLDQEIMTLARTVEDQGVYGNAFWQAKKDRRILDRILGDWWDWLGEEANSKNT